MKNKKIYSTFVFILAVVVIFVTAAFTRAFLDNAWKEHTQPTWYAVHLNNNEVYFGHIASLKQDTITLRDVYFLEAYQEPVERSTSNSFALEQAPRQGFRMVERGSEGALLSDHTLYINREMVLYFEKLDPAAQVVKLIEATK